MLTKVLTLLVCLPTAILAQRRVDLRNTYVRVLAVVPFIGAGTPADPKRPEYAPLPVPGRAPLRSGIIAWHFIVSDDGKFALVEFVARDRAALQPILADKRPNVKAFEKGKARKDDVLGEFKNWRKDFDIDKFGINVP